MANSKLTMFLNYFVIDTSFKNPSIKILSILILLFFTRTNIYSQDTLNKTAVIGVFKEFRSGNEKDVVSNVQNELLSIMEKKGFQVKTIPSQNLDEGIAKSKSLKAGVFISGYYGRSKDTGNINLYAQIYNPDTGLLIDAFSLTDEQYFIEGLDKDELKEQDIVRIKKFSEKVSRQVQINHSHKENRNNIDDYLLALPIGSEEKFPLSKQEEGKSADDVFNLLAEQVTVSSTKISTKTSDAPNFVSVISKEDIKDFGRTSINDILYQLPGFAPSQDYDRKTVTGRGVFEGWNNNHLLMLVDGVQFNDNLYGSAYTSEITPTSMIKTLEVVRGPGSSLYGTNAMNGVVSINTFSGADFMGKVSTRTRLGDYKTGIVDVQTGNVGKYFSYVLSYNGYKTDGNNYNSYDGSGRLEPTGNFLQKFSTRDNRQNNYIFTKIEGEGALKGFSFQYHRQYWDFKTGQGWLWYIPEQKDKEYMKENREIMTAKYSGKIGTKFAHEYVFLSQAHNIDWTMKYFTNNSFEGYYPDGVWEVLKTGSRNYFGRAQWTYFFGGGASILGGMEAGTFKYDRDKQHYANIGLADAANGYPPYGPGTFAQQGKWLEWIAKKPVPNLGAFAQFVSGRLLDKLVEFTLGVRFDETQAKFKAIDEPISTDLGVPFYRDSRRLFRSVNPRLGIVFFPLKTLTIKLTAGTAFRAPSITEMFGANTFTLASNPRKLQPEKTKTYEAGFDWFLNKYINVRMNAFHTNFENQIAYSVANNNLSTNIYSLVTRGIESEILATIKQVSGFLNYSKYYRLSEKVLDETISKSNGRLTWAPTYTSSIGVKWRKEKFVTTLSLSMQGAVYRRNSDQFQFDETTRLFILDPSVNYMYRKQQHVSPWTSLNFRFAWNFTEDISLGLFISNALNTSQQLVKNYYFPFDYYRENRRVMVDFSAAF